MNIIFDNIVFSLQKSGGVSVVWSEMIKKFLIQKDINIRFLEAENKENNIFRKELNIPTDQVIEPKYPFLYIQRYINPVINIKEPFIFHSSYYRVCKNKHAINITTVHDFTYEYFTKGIKKKIHCLQKYQAIRNSDYIICISENTKKDLLHFLPDIDENKIVVIPNGISEDYRIIPQAKFSKNIPFKKNEYLLFVGSRNTYKNFNLVLEAIAASKFKLVIVGKPLNDGEKNMIVKKKVSPKSYICLNNISNQDLNLLYNNAFALLYPSSYEGFGIPVLEAQKAGCPVIAYNGSSIPEIIGDTPLLLNDLSVEAILSKLDIIHDNRQREYIIKKGIENASKYTWENTFNKVLSLYKKAWENT
jgi:mannosyltransferase